MVRLHTLNTVNQMSTKYNTPRQLVFQIMFHKNYLITWCNGLLGCRIWQWKYLCCQDVFLSIMETRFAAVKNLPTWTANEILLNAAWCLNLNFDVEEIVSVCTCVHIQVHNGYRYRYTYTTCNGICFVWLFFLSVVLYCHAVEMVVVVVVFVKYCGCSQK